MKFNFKLTNIEVAEIKIGSVEVGTEFSINEMVAVRKETEVVLAKMPQYLEQLANGYKKFLELDSEIEDLEDKSIQESLIKNLVNEKVISQLNKVKSIKVTPSYEDFEF